MQANETHISLETARLLKSCGIKIKSRYGYRFTRYPMEISDDITLEKISNIKKFFGAVFYPSYTRQEILREYAEEFFGHTFFSRESIEFTMTKKVAKTLGTGTSLKGIDDFTDPEFILQLLQQKKYQEADLYFRRHCVLIK